MFDNAVGSEPSQHTYLSHDMPCSSCGHALHTFLACSDTCDCVPALAPYSRLVTV